MELFLFFTYVFFSYLLLNFFELLLIHIFSGMSFEMKFINSESSIVVCKKKLFLPFTNDIKYYRNLKRVYCKKENVGLGALNIFGVLAEFLSASRDHERFSMPAALIMEFEKMHAGLFNFTMPEYIALKCEKDINKSIENAEGYKILFTPVTIADIRGLLLMIFFICALAYTLPMFIGSYLNITGIYEHETILLIMFFGPLVSCCLVSLAVNLSKKFKKAQSYKVEVIDVDEEAKKINRLIIK